MNYQSNNDDFDDSADGDLSSEAREMTQEETEFVENKINANKDKLKGIVNVSASINFLSF